VTALAIAVLGAACRDNTALPIAAGTKTIADSADQIVFKSRWLVTDRGLQRAAVESDTAYFFDDNKRLEMVTVHGIFFGSTGEKTAVMTSRTGKYNLALSTLEARGDVEINSIDGRKLSTPFVRFDSRSNQISGDSVFVMKEADGREVRGVGFVTDPDLQNLTVIKLISAKAGAVPIPEQ